MLAKFLVLLRVGANLLSNSLLSGAASGTPGTPPTSWPFVLSAGTTAAATDSITLSVAGAARHIVGSNSIVMAPGETMTASVNVDAVTGAAGDGILNINPSSGTLTTSPALTVASGTGRKTLTFTAGAGGATIRMWLGVGTAGATVGAASVTLSHPKIERGSSATGYRIGL